jgi:hypothetical protein
MVRRVDAPSLVDINVNVNVNIIGKTAPDALLTVLMGLAAG